MNDSPEVGTPAREAAMFKKVGSDKLKSELPRTRKSKSLVAARDRHDLIVNAYSDICPIGRPTVQWQKLVRKALEKLHAPHVKVISVSIEQDDSVLRPWNVRLRGVPAMIAFRAGQPVPVQYVGAPDFDKLTSWIGKSLGLGRGLPDAFCGDEPTPPE